MTQPQYRETRTRLPDGSVLVERLLVVPVVPDPATELLDAIDGTGTTSGPKPSEQQREESE
ncbi:hypothetical protein [Amycolatopsis sp. VC5-11]|uniref:hypothetical protein n=1 Tax=Amycolatopsis sp. VC5-11 TaxID=3120156 RepID=UPI00300BA5AA